MVEWGHAWQSKRCSAVVKGKAWEKAAQMVKVRYSTYWNRLTSAQSMSGKSESQK